MLLKDIASYIKKYSKRQFVLPRYLTVSKFLFVLERKTHFYKGNMCGGKFGAFLKRL